MKKIILCVIALLAILWVAMFVTETKILVWEKTPGQVYAMCEARNAEDKKAKEEGKFVITAPWDTTCDKRIGWSCTYFNGRRLINKRYRSTRDSCPNLL